MGGVFHLVVDGREDHGAIFVEEVERATFDQALDHFSIDRAQVHALTKISQ